MERFSGADYEEVRIDTGECLDRAIIMRLIKVSGKLLEVTDTGRKYIESYRIRR